VIDGGGAGLVQGAQELLIVLEYVLDELGVLDVYLQHVLDKQGRYLDISEQFIEINEAESFINLFFQAYIFAFKIVDRFQPDASYVILDLFDHDSQPVRKWLQ
jgi:hypothetical protein